MSGNLHLNDVQAAYQRIRSHIHRTPVLTCSAINRLVGAEIFFKCENMQKTGAFKIRGASNAILGLSEAEAAGGVITHSSGNHAAAVSLAARLRGIPAHIVMPETAPRVKVAAVKSYGGKITFCRPYPKDREETAEEIIRETGATLIHSYNDERIIAGQGTAALELLDQVPGLEVVMTPLGGGGLTSGTSIAVKGTDPHIRMIACEPELVDDAYQSKKQGRIVTMEQPRSLADGLLMPLREKTFPYIRDLVDEIALAPEEAIVQAMQLIYERMKIIIEPSSAVVPAVLLSGRVDIQGKKTGIILSGGNVDMKPFFQYLEKIAKDNVTGRIAGEE